MRSHELVLRRHAPTKFDSDTLERKDTAARVTFLLYGFP